MPKPGAKQKTPSLIERISAVDRLKLDLQGYLVIENALESELLVTLNEAIDKQHLPPPTTYNYFGTAPHGSGLLDWDPGFAELIDHINVRDWIQFLISGNYILERIQGIYEEQFIGNSLDTPQDCSRSLEFRNRLACEIIWNLTDSGPGIGGFACLEGSQNYWGALPQDNPESLQDLIKVPQAPAGSAIICSNRLLRGSSKWYGPHQRRSLVFGYAAIQDDKHEPQITRPRYELSVARAMYLGYRSD